MAAYKIWRLGETTHATGAAQDIDHVWYGNPTTAQNMIDCAHHGKIKVYGNDCIDVAYRMVDAMNAADAVLRKTDKSPQATRDRKQILAAMPSMGSMATASLYTVLGLNYGEAGFHEALKAASTIQLDALIAKCRPI
jgi:hypothetical protein